MAMLLTLLLLLQAPDELPDPDDEPDLHPLSPMMRDLERFPNEAINEQQIVVWRRHVEWLKLVEPAWGGEWRARHKRWIEESEESLLVWQELMSARNVGGWADSRRESLAKVRRLIGWSNYYAGVMPTLPTWLHKRAWRDDDPTKGAGE